MLGHQWSGWPGAYCLKCGVEHALENAIGNNWVDLVPASPPPALGAAVEAWISEDHRTFVNLCDSVCTADLTEPERKVHEARLKESHNKIMEFDKSKLPG